MVQIFYFALPIRCFSQTLSLDKNELSLPFISDLEDSDSVDFMVNGLNSNTFAESDENSDELFTFDQFLDDRLYSDEQPSNQLYSDELPSDQLYSDELPSDQLLFAPTDCSQPLNKRRPEKPAACPIEKNPVGVDIPNPLLRPSWRTEDPKLVPMVENPELCPVDDEVTGRLFLNTDVFCDSGRQEHRIYSPDSFVHDLKYATPFDIVSGCFSPRWVWCCAIGFPIEPVPEDEARLASLLAPEIEVIGKWDAYYCVIVQSVRFNQWLNYWGPLPDTIYNVPPDIPPKT